MIYASFDAIIIVLKLPQYFGEPKKGFRMM